MSDLRFSTCSAGPKMKFAIDENDFLLCQCYDPNQSTNPKCSRGVNHVPVTHRSKVVQSEPPSTRAAVGESPAKEDARHTMSARVVADPVGAEGRSSTPPFDPTEGATEWEPSSSAADEASIKDRLLAQLDWQLECGV